MVYIFFNFPSIISNFMWALLHTPKKRMIRRKAFSPGSRSIELNAPALVGKFLILTMVKVVMAGAILLYEDAKIFMIKMSTTYMQDCYLSIICFQNGDKLISENKVKLEMLEADISNQGLKNLFEGQFSNCLSFSQTTSRAINYIPNFTMLNFPC